MKLREESCENLSLIAAKVGQLLLIDEELLRFSGADFPDCSEVVAGFPAVAWDAFKKEHSLSLAPWESAIVDTSASQDRSSPKS